jgi:TonB-dependent receptor
MYRANWNSRFSSSVGLRFEGTELEYRSLDQTDSIFLNYNNWFPSLNLTYRLDKDRQLRFAYYEAIARPAYAQLFPTDQIQSGNRRILRGNAQGQPVYGHNLDLAYERYGRRDGLFSAALYAKFLDAPFVREARYEEINDAPFLVTNVVNAENAIIAGAELGLYQNLGFLNAGLRFFNVNATYNYNYSSVKSNEPEQDGLPLVGSPRQSANLSLVYNNSLTRLTFVIAGNYRDRTLDRLQDGQPIYRENIINLDLSLDYELIENLSLYGRVNNLTNPVIEEYRGVPGSEGTPYASQQFGSWAVIGVRFRQR